MKILILHGSSDLYGSSKILLIVVKTFQKKGYTPIVVLNEDGPLAVLLRESNIEIHFIRLGILRRKYKNIKGIFNRFYVMIRALKEIKGLITEKKIELVYSNTTAVLVGAIAAKSKQVKHVWHIHEIIEKPFWLFYILGNIIDHYSTQVITVSNAVKDSWSKYVSANKLKLIYNGIDYTPYQIPSNKLRIELGLEDDQIIIGMIGRVHPWKGQEYFLDIASALLKNYPLLHFVMVGDAYPGNEYLYKKINDRIKELNISNSIHDLGYRNDVPEILQGFDILVLPSTLPDPFPTVILESMASGKAVVATDHGGAQEMIEEQSCGILIPINNAKIASAKMSIIIEDKDLCKKMGETGRKRVFEKFSVSAFEETLINAIE